jgi:hypothetical protein
VETDLIVVSLLLVTMFYCEDKEIFSDCFDFKKSSFDEIAQYFLFEYWVGMQVWYWVVNSHVCSSFSRVATM